jgi:hypothetical protein
MQEIGSSAVTSAFLPDRPLRHSVNSIKPPGRRGGGCPALDKRMAFVNEMKLCLLVNTEWYSFLN